MRRSLPSVIARHPLRRSLRRRRGARWLRLPSGDLRDFLLAYVAGLLAFGTFLS